VIYHNTLNAGHGCVKSEIILPTALSSGLYFAHVLGAGIHKTLTFTILK
jgi:hypothetical protein